MLRRFKASAIGRRLRRAYVKQRGLLQYVLGKTVLRWFVRARKEQFAHNLVLLNDALEMSSLAGHYWIWGGLLLGWARDGEILDHDYHDADFGFFSEDRQKFLNSIEAIVQAGFQPLVKWTNNDGDTTEYTFVKDNAKFEFFEMRKRGESLWFHTYSPAAALQTVNAIPAHGLQSMAFLDRIWLKPSDHDACLTGIYGDWRQPDPSWDWLEDDRSIREIKRWVGARQPIESIPVSKEAS